MKRFNKIVSTFTTTINKLDKLEGTCTKKVESINKSISDLEYSKKMEIAEGRAAANVSKKLKELIGTIEK